VNLVGHLGEETVEHVALHMPIIVQELLESMPCAVNGPKLDVEAISKGLKRRITEFDEAITKDVLDLWPGGLDGLSKLTNEHISSVINDGGKNLKKTKLCMYGTTALVALIDPTRENLWVANVGDCQGGAHWCFDEVRSCVLIMASVLITTKPSGEATAEVLTRLHNGMNKSEILRVLREHPGEPGCVSNERVLGVIAPFRCTFSLLVSKWAAFDRR
jgi:pyruvate dehydrogenase phosphatase